MLEFATTTSSPFCGSEADPERSQLLAEFTSEGELLAVVAVKVQVAEPP